MIDLSVGESLNNRFCKTFREVLDDLLSWEEIRARKHRRRVVVSSSELSSSPVLFPSPFSFSLSTPVAQATPLTSASSRDGSIASQIRADPYSTLPTCCVSPCSDPYRGDLGQGL